MKLASTLLLALAFLTLPGSAQDKTVPVPELETLKQEYASLVKTADGPHLAAVAELDKKYIAKLEQAQQTAQQAGKLDDALAIDAEKKAISSGSGVPVGDDAKTQGVLKKMHAMHGNVGEWCEDWLGAKLAGGTDPTGVTTGSRRVIRGGNWSCSAKDCRAASRNNNNPGNTYNCLGFRVALSSVP